MKKQVLFKLIPVFIITIFLFSMGACTGETKAPPPPKAQTIKIGAILPLTGNLAFFGENGKNAITLLEKEINASNEGKKIEIKIYDSKSTPKDGLTAYKKMLFDGIKYCYVSLDPIAKSILPHIEKDGVTMFVCSVDNEIAKSSPNVFRLYYGFKEQTEAQIELIKEMNPKKLKLFIINVAHAIKYANIIKEKLTNADGSTTPILETYQPITKDFKDPITKLLADSPDVLVLSDYGQSFPAIFKELRTKKNLPKLVCGLGMLNVRPNDYPLYENVIFTVPEYLVNLQENSFYKKYMAAYEKNPHYEAFYAYDSLNTLYLALKNTDQTTTAVADYLLKNTFTGTSQSQIKFDENGDLQVSIKLQAFENGKTKPYQPK